MGGNNRGDNLKKQRKQQWEETMEATVLRPIVLTLTLKSWVINIASLYYGLNMCNFRLLILINGSVLDPVCRGLEERSNLSANRPSIRVKKC